MPIYQVSYDLNKPGQNYARIEAALKASHNWRVALKSTWLVWTAETATQLQTRLLRAIDKSDRLFISRVTAENGGFMDKAVWAWINARLQVEAKAGAT